MLWPTILLLISPLCTIPACTEFADGFVPLFDGQSLVGWEGDTTIFRIEDGEIIGGSLESPVRRNEFLCTTRQFGDFELRLQCKLVGKVVNGGVQFRSRRIANSNEVSGYQADLGDQWWGCLFDESRRNVALANADQKSLVSAIRPTEWNEYTIRCEGRRIQLWFNGLQTVDYTEPDSGIAQNGIIALQIHESGPSEARYRNVRIKDLNPISPAEFAQSEGDDSEFTTIFDGKSLAGWQISTESGHSKVSGNKSGGRWFVENGAIVGSQDVPGNGGILVTEKEYGNFEVTLEMKNDFGLDSGLFLRSTVAGQAYQYLIDYYETGNIAGLYGEGLSGTLDFRNFDFGRGPQTITAHASASPLPVHPCDWPQFWKQDSWNRLKARIEGNPPKITTWINGVKFMEYQDDERRLDDKGRIALQVHGGGDLTNKYVRYRNIKVMPLKSSD